ncbi:MAG: GTP-binding protein [Candidatus Lokiarchaeota archaeon]|nr:GTP-binding protein [Candidatus Lokiarchaeota archaeon]
MGRNTPDYIFKIVVGGAGGVGKTTLLHRYLHDVFKTDTTLTVGVAFQTKEIIRNGLKISLSLWDLGGQDRFRFLQPTYCQGARAGIVFFDMNRFGTMEQVKDWVAMFRKHAFPGIPIILGGTKLDLVDPGMLDMVTSSAKESVEALGLAGFVPTSSKSGENVEEIILNLVDMLVAQAASAKPAAVPTSMP